MKARKTIIMNLWQNSQCGKFWRECTFIS